MLMTLVMTNNCNLRCKYCFTGEKKQTYMTEEIAQKSIDFYMKNCTEKGRVNFFGGEPLLCHNLISSIVNYNKNLYKSNIEFSITTNGTIMNEDIYKLIYDNKMLVTLSVDGNKLSQNTYRVDEFGNGSFDKLNKMLPFWKKMSSEINNVQIRMTLDVDNVTYLFDSVKFLHSQGFRRIAFAPNISDHWTADKIAELKIQYEEIANYYITENINGNRLNISNFEKYIKNEIFQLEQGCDAAYKKFAVAPTGKIYPCHAFVREDTGEFSIGDIFIGFDKRRDSFLNDIQREPKCKSCKLFKRCGSTCLAINEYNNKDINKIQWFSCLFEQMSIEFADKVGYKMFQEKGKSYIEHIIGRT